MKSCDSMLEAGFSCTEVFVFMAGGHLSLESRCLEPREEGILRPSPVLQCDSSGIRPLCSSENSKYMVLFLFGKQDGKHVSQCQVWVDFSLVLLASRSPHWLPLYFSWEDAEALRSLRS